MIRKILSSIVLLATSVTLFSQNATTGREYRPGQMIVKFKDGSDLTVRRSQGRGMSTSNTSINQVLDAIDGWEMTQLMPLTGDKKSRVTARDYKGNDVPDADLSQLYLVSFSEKTDVIKAINAVSELDEVEFAEPNYIVHTQTVEQWGTADPLYCNQWHLPSVNMPQLWYNTGNVPNKLGHRPVIAILDTGIDINHPDLAANIWSNPGESENGADDDRNGFKDDIHGWDFVNQTGRIGDYNGHGTHCAGIAAAVGGNGIGIVGANPDALIMPVTVLQSNGAGDIATIVKGIDYAAANGADVISMSLGGYDYSQAEDLALGKAYGKCFIVAAAGNNGLDVEYRPMYPGAFTYVLGVQASQSNGFLACFSNLDSNGPVQTVFDEEKLYNYEISAPGVDIYSTYPGGRYKYLNGTSMACPFVAGVVSRILQSKDVYSYEQLFGDIIHTSGPLYSCMGVFLNKYGGPINVNALYSLKDSDRKPNIHFVTVEYNDSLGDCDGRLDAGEIVDIYPVIRNDWGEIDSEVIVSLDYADNEDPTICEFIQNDVRLGNALSSYGKVKFQTPVRIKLRDDIVDGRIVRLVVKIQCENISEDYRPQEFTFKVENGVELGGIQAEDITLYPGVQYIVTKNWGIPKDRVVTVKAGTTIKIKDNVGISNYGYMLFEGTRDSMITITKGDNDYGYVEGFLNDNANYVDFNYVIFENFTGMKFHYHRYNNCIIRNNTINEFTPPDNDLCYPYSLSRGGTFKGCEIYNNSVIPDLPGYPGVLSNNATFIETSIHDNIVNEGFGTAQRFYHSNYIGNEILHWASSPDIRTIEESNVYGNYFDFICLADNQYYVPGFYSVIFETTEPEVFYLSKAYLGTANDKVAQKSIMDYDDNIGWGSVSVAQKLNYANEYAPVCVDYVKVDGLNPLDDEEQLSPLGVGRHLVEVGFNREMDQSVAPTISMGLRPPYTQIEIAEDGYWYDPWTYRAYMTIDGRSATDGTNRIRVYGYKQKNQNPEFSAPDEKYRYNVLVSAAGSLSTGMMATPGLGKVMLEWQTDTADFDDLMGYNLYRFTKDTADISSDSIMINKTLIEITDTSFIDYDVVPGITYYYFIKEIGTDLVENFVSSTVAATPLTSIKGDANGSMTVDIADVMSEISYLSNDNPEPFIFEAADVNSDNTVNILDVVGTLNIITKPESGASAVEQDYTAYCYVLNNVLYIDSEIPLGGIQVRLKSGMDNDVIALHSLDGMEQLSVQVSNEDRVFLAYSMSGVVVPIGKNPIMTVPEGLDILDIVLSTPRGKNVKVTLGTPTLVKEIPSETENSTDVVYDVFGRRLDAIPERGIYIINGKKYVR